MRFVGGFFELELPPASGPGLAADWNMPADPAASYANARSALAALIVALRPAKIWLPAFVCRAVAEAAAAARVAVDYFPVGSQLTPDIGFLDAMARSGEMVLAVDYFGAAPTDRFIDFAQRRTDLLFVEDAAQALDTGRPQWAGWRLHSPRKLVGVADGGFVTPAAALARQPAARPQSDRRHYDAACLRFEDTDGEANALWHGVNQAREAAETVDTRRMSRLSRDLLERLPTAPIAAQRRENFRVLADALQAVAFLPVGDPRFVPFGFPIRLAAGRRAALRQRLIEQGIFPAIHWQDLPSPASFADEHALADQLLTLPCDHRYRPADMERVAASVLPMLPAS